MFLHVSLAAVVAAAALVFAAFLQDVEDLFDLNSSRMVVSNDSREAGRSSASWLGGHVASTPWPEISPYFR